jgi:hypothetical protein
MKPRKLTAWYSSDRTTDSSPAASSPASPLAAPGSDNKKPRSINQLSALVHKRRFARQPMTSGLPDKQTFSLFVGIFKGASRRSSCSIQNQRGRKWWSIIKELAKFFNDFS